MERSKRWTKALKEAFLDHLAATCNIRESARSIGMCPTKVYRLRRKDAAFAAAWSAALQLGYEMLETRLVGHALNSRSVHEPLERDGYDPMDTQLALTLLTSHRNGINGKPSRGGPKLKQVSEEETNAALLRKLDAMERKARARG